MNGIHDMGGMHGMGPIQLEDDEPVFHEPWEARMFALNLAMRAWRRWNIDQSRNAVESLAPDEYLRASYYEKRIPALIELAVQAGMVTRDEVESGRAAAGSPKSEPTLSAARVPVVLAKGNPASRETQDAPRFGIGQRVRARNIHPAHHTRLPRYARGKAGTIHLLHGAHVFPDTSAQGLGEQPQHLYNVRFAARELWGEHAGAHDAVYIDLWEAYLEPV